MAAEKNTSSTKYPNKYDSGKFFSDEEILTHDHMNFIAKNINAIIDALTWK